MKVEKVLDIAKPRTLNWFVHEDAIGRHTALPAYHGYVFHLSWGYCMATQTETGAAAAEIMVAGLLEIVQCGCNEKKAQPSSYSFVEPSSGKYSPSFFRSGPLQLSSG
jgi:hypothetical protein